MLAMRASRSGGSNSQPAPQSWPRSNDSHCARGSWMSLGVLPAAAGLKRGLIGFPSRSRSSSARCAVACMDSAFGGYGLYYRSPLVELGIVARAGTLLGEKPIPIDVLRETPRAQRLAATFKAAVEHTTYYQRAMWTSDDLSADLIDEYAEVACLCRLRDQLD